MRSAALFLSLTCATTVALPALGDSATAGPDKTEPAAYSFAVIGDIPYGAAQVAAFPGWVDRISADDDLRLVTHVGDIKNGSSPCSDEYFHFVRTQLDRFDTPLVYTPGDNEWTDCHRLNNGAYDPYERLDAVRATFFDDPGTTLGAKTMKVDAQAGYPENVDWHASRVTFLTAHVVGSNSGLKPWTGATAPNQRQVDEVAARTDAAIALLHTAFAEAKERDDRAVVVFQQADMFDPSYTPAWTDISAFQPWVQALVDEAADFDGSVYLFDGDSHTYNVDRPLAPGSPWLTTYAVSGSAANLTRVTVDGEANNTAWLKVSVGRSGPEVLSWERVPYE